MPRASRRFRRKDEGEPTYDLVCQDDGKLSESSKLLDAKGKSFEELVKIGLRTPLPHKEERQTEE